MDYQKLLQYTAEIENCPLYSKNSPKCGRIAKFKPVINTLLPSQRYMIISSDPSGDTNKELDDTQPHSDFALRFLALVFTGSDNENSVNKILENFKTLNEIFFKYFYWTHYCKCYAEGSPRSYCARLYLLKEIELFQPSLIISLGGKPMDLLLGKDKLINRVNKKIDYQGIPIIASLHPSRNWNLNRRPQFLFDETWNLIRTTIKYSEEDLKLIRKLLN